MPGALADCREIGLHQCGGGEVVGMGRDVLEMAVIIGEQGKYGASSTPYTTLKIAVTAPMQSASTAMTVTV
jgi:hypothetical protein